MDDRPWNLIAAQLSANGGSAYVDEGFLAKKLGVSSADVASIVDALAYVKEYRKSRGLSTGE